MNFATHRPLNINLQKATPSKRKKVWGFREKVLKVVSKIPRGKTLTYKQVAAKAGRPKAFRAVGNILNKNYDPKIPCHRVIKSNGEIGGYNRGEKLKQQKLRAEGAMV